MTPAHLHSRGFDRARLGADKVARAFAEALADAARSSRDRAQRLARPLLAGAAGRGRNGGGPRRLRPGAAAGRRRPASTPGLLQFERASEALGRVEDIPFL